MPLLRNPRVVLTWFLLGLACLRAAAASQVATLDELKVEGVSIVRRSLDTPMSSVTLKVAVVAAPQSASFSRMQCVVLKAAVAVEELPDIDRLPPEDPGFARRTGTTEREATFLVLGKEVERAYLAFDFASESSSGSPAKRLLIPVRAIPRKKIKIADELEPQG